MKKNSIKQFTLNKRERIKKRKEIEYLFNEGKVFNAPPLRIFYFLQKENHAEALEESKEKTFLKVGVSVSKRHFKKAVDRNRIKRLMREAYRLQKLPLQNMLKDKGYSLQVFFIYTGKELPEYLSIKEKIATVLMQLQQKV
ncbi:MAG TPA: ribonuclease P protein component [Chitinophagaceae bacterium]|nr:ribonuclease P protein component [Chitinophagaceae bacterium]